ncbi:hypothetical protein [Pseudomonas fluorescens]|uniref:hypothetical protein n=1 Tax=Pseudomonas fluorescens TaxID=294 RepID=UPI001431DDF5|nr:hypothetical protein [Pseudomonas fluorescens]
MRAPFAIVRLNEDGSLDTEFGGKGTGYVEIALEGVYISFVWELSGLSDGGWLVLGQYEFTDNSDVGGLVLVRQHKDGRLDESFAEKGVRFIPYLDMGRPGDVGVRAVGRVDKTPSAENLQVANNTGPSAVQQVDGKIVLVSNTMTDSGQKGIVLRFNSDGSTDYTFNEVGFVIVELEGILYDWNSCKSVAVQRDGKVLVCGMYVRQNPETVGAFVTRFDAMGRLDASFNGGTVTVRQSSLIDLTAITVRETDGRVVAVGRAFRDQVSHGLIVVLTAGGFFDFSFNRGQPLFSQLVPQGLTWERCALQADGSILVAGNTGRGFVTEELTAVTARFHSDGSLDPTFNGSGFTVFDEYEGFEAMENMALMTDGRIVVCGVIWIDAEPWPYMDGGWVVRYLA